MMEPPATAFESPAKRPRTQRSADPFLSFMDGLPAPSPPSDSPLDRIHAHRLRSFLQYPFQLLRVRGLPAAANSGPFGVRLKDLCSGEIALALVSSYQIDATWLLSACPDLRKARKLILCHGWKKREPQDVSELLAVGDAIKDRTLIWEPLCNEAGTRGGSGSGVFHSKLIVLVYRAGIRVITCSGNFVLADQNFKTSTLWFQDFPWLPDRPSRATASPETPAPPGCTTSHTAQPPAGHATEPDAPDFPSFPPDHLPDDADLPPFARELTRFVQAMALPTHASHLLTGAIARADMRSARAALVTSIPGRHRTDSSGHLALRRHIRAEEIYRLRSRGPIGGGVRAEAGSVPGEPVPAAASRDESESFSSLAVAAPSPAANEPESSAESDVIFNISPFRVRRRLCSQFSSFPSRLTPAFLDQVHLSFLGGTKEEWDAAGRERVPPLHFFYPSERDVRSSIEGWNGADALPAYGLSDARLREHPAVMEQLRAFDGVPSGRGRALPHSKLHFAVDLPLDEHLRPAATTYSIPWMLLGSQNMSESCWGVQDDDGPLGPRGGRGLRISSFELGVLLLPSLEARYLAHPHRGFLASHPQHNDGGSLPRFYGPVVDQSIPIKVRFTPHTLVEYSSGKANATIVEGGGAGGGGGAGDTSMTTLEVGLLIPFDVDAPHFYEYKELHSALATDSPSSAGGRSRLCQLVLNERLGPPWGNTTFFASNELDAVSLPYRCERSYFGVAEPPESVRPEEILPSAVWDKYTTLWRFKKNEGQDPYEAAGVRAVKDERERIRKAKSQLQPA